ncbi:MAG: exo-alpha-sialidase [Planctomycetota bacterium]|nr:MAG: exo-alpha-sialidase [Planctomycetota bacterium]MCQ3920733.1 hypothetical protein [Planctomycetota bacterium]
MAIAGSQRRVNPTGTIWRECSVAVRFDQPNEAVVAANNIYGEPVAVNVGFGVTFNGGSSFTNGSLGLFSDPGVVADPVTGRMWISALGCTGGIGAVYKDAGSSVFSDICCIRSFSSIDKPLMAIGADGRQYVSYSILTGNCPRALWTGASSTPTDCPWPAGVRMEPLNHPGDCRWVGLGAMPVVLDTGRVVVVNLSRFESGDRIYNDLLPFVLYSDDDGATWLPDADVPVAVAEDSNIRYARPEDTPNGLDRNVNYPSIAVDPTDNSNVYVAFTARAESTLDAADRNTDVYLSRSTNGGLTFPDVPIHLVPLTDLLLTGQPGGLRGPDQVMPAIAVDACGGVNVLFYDDRHDADLNDSVHWYDLYFVRITGYGTPEQAIQQIRLTPTSFLLTPAAGFLGDYQHMAAAPPGAATPTATVYPAYIAMAKDANFQWTQQNCYMHKIQILCGESLGGYGGGEGALVFEKLCGDGVLDSDLNGDGSVDAGDQAMFCEIYDSEMAKWNE